MNICHTHILSWTIHVSGRVSSLLIQLGNQNLNPVKSQFQLNSLFWEGCFVVLHHHQDILTSIVISGQSPSARRVKSQDAQRQVKVLDKVLIQSTARFNTVWFWLLCWSNMHILRVVGDVIWSPKKVFCIYADLFHPSIKSDYTYRHLHQYELNLLSHQEIANLFQHTHAGPMRTEIDCYKMVPMETSANL